MCALQSTDNSEGGFSSSFQNLLSSMTGPDFESQMVNAFSSTDSLSSTETNNDKSNQWMNDPFALHNQHSLTSLMQSNAKEISTSSTIQGDTQPRTTIEIQSKDEGNAGTLIIRQGDALAKISNKADRRYIEITQYLGSHSQREAAKLLGIPSSTLSKRWREATVGRKWPQKIVQKIDKEIESIVRNGTRGANGSVSFSPEAEKAIAELLRKRTHELRPAVIRM